MEEIFKKENENRERKVESREYKTAKAENGQKMLYHDIVSYGACYM
jgi:hypothetical protein